MTLCPFCNQGTRTHRTPGWQHFSCGTMAGRMGLKRQSPACRIRQLEGLLAAMLPLARRVSCEHEGANPRAAGDCCQWAELVPKIEALLTTVNKPEVATR